MSMASCPSCRQPMARHGFAHRMQGVVELDLCFPCQGIWFDEWESPQIAPGGVIDLFRLIHEHRSDLRRQLRETLQCPRCDDRLLHAFDRARSGTFNYHRCLQQHGRFTGFAQFMIEKGFVRQLSGREIKELKARIGVVSCASCGAPLDIGRDSACQHCRSPISILDPDAVDNALAGYRQAAIKRDAPDSAAQVGTLADMVMAGQRQEQTLRRLSRPRLLDVTAAAERVSRLFAD